MTELKRDICVIYIGAAAHTNKGGQLKNIKKESSLGIKFISVDPYHQAPFRHSVAKGANPQKTPFRHSVAKGANPQNEVNFGDGVRNGERFGDSGGVGDDSGFGDSGGVGDDSGSENRKKINFIFQENIEERCGIPVNFIPNNSNDIHSYAINVSNKTADEFFMNFHPNPATFYLILTFVGYDMDHTSFQIAENLQIQTPYFYDLKNALFLGMSCLAIPPDILKILRNYDIPTTEPFVSNIEQSKQNAYYAFLNNIDILCEHYRKKEVREWHTKSLQNLKALNIHSYEDACRYYDALQIKNIPDIRKSIQNYFESINMLKIFKNERENDFH